MALIQNKLATRRKALYIPVTRMNGFRQDLKVIGGDADGAALNHDAVAGNITKVAATDASFLGATAALDQNVRARGVGNGNPRLVAITGLNMVGMLVSLANDGVEFCEEIPSDLDVNFPVGVSVVWTSEAAAVGARTLTWQAKYSTFLLDNLTALAQAATALNTALVAQAPKGTTLTLQKTARGIINAKVIATTKQFWSWKIIMSAFDAALVEAKYLLGVEIDYMPRLCLGARQTKDAALSYLADDRGF